MVPALWRARRLRREQWSPSPHRTAGGRAAGDRRGAEGRGWRPVVGRAAAGQWAAAGRWAARCERRNRTASARWGPRSPGQPASGLHWDAFVRAAFDNIGSDRRGLRARQAVTHAQSNTCGARSLKVRRSPSIAARPPPPRPQKLGGRFRWMCILGYGVSQRARLEMRRPMHHRRSGSVGPNRPHWALVARGRPAEGRPSSLAAPAAIAIRCLVVEHQLAEERSPRGPGDDHADREKFGAARITS